MSAVLRRLARITGFILVPGFSLASSVVLLPIISRSYGADGVAALTIGTSTGAFTSVLVGLAWPVMGAARIAGTSDALRPSIWALSLKTRGIVLLILIVPTVSVAWLLSPIEHQAAALFSAGVCFNGLSAAWYWAGVARALPLVLSEGVTRLASYAAAIAGIALGWDALTWYGLCIFCYGVGAVLLNSVLIRRESVATFSSPGPMVRAKREEVFQELRSQVYGTVSRLAQAVFSFSGASTIALVAPAGLNLYAQFDQLQKTLFNASTSVISGLQGLMHGGSQHQTQRRAKQVMAICIGGAVVFMALFSIWGDEVVRLVFGPRTLLTGSLIALLAVCVSVPFILRAIELLVLVPSGKQRLVYTSNILASLAGYACLVVAATVIKGTAIVVALLGAAVIGFGFYVVIWIGGSALRRKSRRRLGSLVADDAEEKGV